MYSAHPVLASKQLQNAEFVPKQQQQSRRHNSSENGGGSGSGTVSPTKIRSLMARMGGKFLPPFTSPLSSTSSSSSSTSTSNTLTNNLYSNSIRLPDRTDFDDLNFADIEDNTIIKTTIPTTTTTTNNSTKDCVDSVLSNASIRGAGLPSIDEANGFQQRFSRIRHYTDSLPYIDNSSECDGGLTSGLSSIFSSPSASTASTPFSTPTRLSPHFPISSQKQHQQQQKQKQFCPKVATPSSTTTTATTTAATTSTTNPCIKNLNIGSGVVGGVSSCGSKKLQKFDPRFGPSPYRALLPIGLCILSFATVFSLLIIYMDTTEIRHQQFRLNMSRDADFFGVAQDDPTLIAFLREIHMRKYPMNYFKNNNPRGETNSIEQEMHQPQQLNFSAPKYHNELAPQMAQYIAELLNNKLDGTVIQSMPGSLGHLMTAPWLVDTLNWAGILIEPEPRRFFTLRKQNAQRTEMQVVHACVSPNPYPKEVSIHNEDADVRINSLLDEETSWFNSRVKCFPLYTIMLACKRVEYDLLSLGVHGHELEILQTLPFNKVKIEVISIHLPDDHEDVRRNGTNTGLYLQALTKFLTGKSYKMQKEIGRNYFYQRVNSTSRTRKKDILLLKTP